MFYIEVHCNLTIYFGESKVDVLQKLHMSRRQISKCISTSNLLTNDIFDIFSIVNTQNEDPSFFSHGVLLISTLCPSFPLLPLP